MNETLMMKTILENTEGVMQKDTEDAITQVSDALFKAEDAMSGAIDELIRKERNPENPGESFERVRGIIEAAKVLGLRISETPYTLDRDHRPITSGGTYEYSVAIGADEENEAWGEGAYVQADITLIPETGEAYYTSVLDWIGGDCHTIDSGYVKIEETPNLVKDLLYYGLDLLTEHAANANLSYSDEEAEENFKAIEEAEKELEQATKGYECKLKG